MKQLSILFRWDGTVGRGFYALVGVIGFAFKHNLDRLVATVIFHRRWGIFNYWIPPVQVLHFSSLPRADAIFLGSLLAMALPFIWVGVALTVRRLRARDPPELTSQRSAKRQRVAPRGKPSRVHANAVVGRSARNGRNGGSVPE